MPARHGQESQGSSGATGRKVFLDVGAHRGQTIEAVLSDRFGFDRIVAFEPAPGCLDALASLAGGRVEICPFGLSDRSGERELFAAGTMGGSIYAEKNRASEGEPCRFVRASEWVRLNLDPADSVYMKLNCEGSECDILEDLLDSGEISRITCVMVDFDVRKIPSQRHREGEVLDRLRRVDSTRVDLSGDVMIGPTHASRIRNWLEVAGTTDRRSGPLYRAWNRLAGRGVGAVFQIVGRLPSPLRRAVISLRRRAR